jgi:hypothetical protein
MVAGGRRIVTDGTCAGEGRRYRDTIRERLTVEARHIVDREFLVLKVFCPRTIARRAASSALSSSASSPSTLALHGENNVNTLGSNRCPRDSAPFPCRTRARACRASGRPPRTRPARCWCPPRAGRPRARSLRIPVGDEDVPAVVRARHSRWTTTGISGELEKTAVSRADPNVVIAIRDSGGRRIRLLFRAPFLNPLEVFDERLDPCLDRLFRRSRM